MIEAVRDLGTRVTPLYDGTVPPKVASALLRALEWIGSSITRESYDDKVVDLCTALECMLGLKSDGRKGEAIALRYILLSGLRGGLYIMPHMILPAYQTRSQVIHGSHRRVATPIQYTALREIAMETVTMVLDVVQRDNSIRTVKHLVDLLESDHEAIRRSLEMVLDGDRIKSDREVEKYAHTILHRGNKLVEGIRCQ